ncbi:hypothetical protein, partial [Ralstonia solanacearum]|uniref:hypothetical protein n=1 Tax=Ralstonia solanacearum TaxID=305 RepID=UPI001E56806B
QTEGRPPIERGLGRRFCCLLLCNAPEDQQGLAIAGERGASFGKEAEQRSASLSRTDQSARTPYRV